MAEVETLHVKTRRERGTRAARRLRAGGVIPAVLYGHGEEVRCLAVPGEEISAMIRHGSRVVELQGDVRETAMIRDVQWDTFQSEVLHIDFARVSRHEVVEVTLPIELRGEAPGVRQGGVVEQLVHGVDIQCPAVAIPESIEVTVNELELGGSLSLADLVLPEGATLMGDASATVVQCVEPVEVVEEELVPAEAEEPEMIGRKEEGEGEEGESSES